MTDRIEEQDVELDDDGVMEAQAHDPKKAEAQSVSATDKAGDAVNKQAPARRGDKRNGDPVPNTKAGLMGALFKRMEGMAQGDLSNLYKRMMGEELEGDDQAVVETVDIDVDFTEDLNALVESEATLSEEFKEKTAVIFEAAVKTKITEEIDRLEEQYQQELEEEVSAIKEELVEKVDSYLNYVVETWMEDNELAIEQGLRAEIAENFMNSLKELFVESYIEVPENKVDLVDELATANEELEESFNDAVTKAIALSEELEHYKREAVIREAASDLAETQIEKLRSLSENVEFEDEESFAEKIATIKESYFSKKKTENGIVFEEADENDDTDINENVSDVMQSYLAAIRKTKK